MKCSVPVKKLPERHDIRLIHDYWILRSLSIQDPSSVREQLGCQRTNDEPWAGFEIIASTVFQPTVHLWESVSNFYFRSLYCQKYRKFVERNLWVSSLFFTMTWGNYTKYFVETFSSQKKSWLDSNRTPPLNRWKKWSSSRLKQNS